LECYGTCHLLTDFFLLCDDPGFLNNYNLNSADRKKVLGVDKYT
jgi:hypothetical protein